MKLCAFILGLILPVAALAGQNDAISSCHNQKLQVESAPIATEIFIAIDQTTLLDMKLKQLVADNIKPFLNANHGFTVMTFSAYTQGRYTEVVVSGKLNPALEASQRNDISKPLLAKFDHCMASQPQQAARIVGGALRTAFDGTSTDIAKSDVLASIKAISSKVRQSTAQNKVVLIVSDMLENSSVSSFYSDKGQSVRKIEPLNEMKLVEHNQLLADFGGARIYVIGAGLLSGDAHKSKRYRDPQTMQALTNFWRLYFEKSNAHLVEMGKPALLNPVQ